MLRLITLSWCHGSEPANRESSCVFDFASSSRHYIRRAPFNTIFSNGQMLVDPPPLSPLGLGPGFNFQWFQPAHENPRHCKQSSSLARAWWDQPLHSGHACSLRGSVRRIYILCRAKVSSAFADKEHVAYISAPVPPSHQPSALPFDCFKSIAHVYNRFVFVFLLFGSEFCW